MLHLIALVGTNSEKSTNRQLLQFIAKHFSKQAQIELMEIDDIPLFSKGAMAAIPEAVQKKEAKISAADGVIIATPEYDHSITSALQNALEWFSVGTHPFLDKPVMIVGASYGTLGSSRAQAQLRQILDAPELRAYIMPSSEFHLSHSLSAFDDDNHLKDEETVKQLEALFSDFLTFIHVTSQLTETHKQHQEELRHFSWETLNK